MPDDVFSPFPAISSVAPGSAEVIYLERALFVIRGMFFDPIANADAPLPPHRWAIAHSETAYGEGNTSDADGFSTIFDPARGDVPPDGEWDLYMIPIYDGRPDSDLYATHKEAWIDLEAKKWVPGDEIRDGTRYEHLATRKLLRIPLWSTKRMVESGGGFVGTFPHSGTFATTGVLKTSELLPHGTREAPWVMQVDQGWLRTHVRLRCYDPVARADRNIGQGPLVIAKNGIANVVGGSSVVLPNGSTYVVHGGTQEKLPNLYYQFETPPFSWIEYAAGTADTLPTLDTLRFETHYLLPAQWASVGQECWTGTGNPSASTRKAFAELRHSGTTSDQPLSFHLDDLGLTHTNDHLLGEQSDHTVVLPSSRVALLDHLLALRSPASNAHGGLPYSQLNFTKYPLRAEDAMFVAGQGFETMTRIVDYDGRLFAVAEHRVRGLMGFDLMVGARAAKAQVVPTGPNVTGVSQGNNEVHLVDTRWIRHTYQGTAARLAHVLVYVPAFVTAPAADDMPGGVNAARTIGVPLCEHLLLDAALVWDQIHPAHPSAPTPRKTYAILSAAGLTAEKTVVRMRHHFGSRTSAGRVSAVAPAVPPPAVAPPPDTLVTINVHPQAGRATGGNPMQLYLVFGPLFPAPPVNPHPPAPRPYDFEAGTTPSLDRIDNASEVSFTLAHELGHSMGLPDEYVERVRAGPTTNGTMARFDSRPRPYHLDDISMMKGEYAPRLRYAWQRVRNLALLAQALPTTHWSRTEAPFRVQYVAGARTLNYALPTDVPQFGADPEPWRPINGRVGRSEVNLYIASDDESTRGPILTASGILASAFDGALVVSPKFWFTFDASIAAISDRWEVMYDNFGRTYYRTDLCPKFFIAGPSGATRLMRIVVILQPRFEYGANPSTRFDGNPETLANADIEVRVKTGARSLVTGSPDVLTIREGDVGHFLIRYALSPTAAVFNARNNAAITATDLAPLNAFVATTLGRGAGTVTPV